MQVLTDKEAKSEELAVVVSFICDRTQRALLPIWEPFNLITIVDCLQLRRQHQQGLGSLEK